LGIRRVGFSEDAVGQEKSLLESRGEVAERLKAAVC
jgi:hypothetical protein